MQSVGLVVPTYNMSEDLESLLNTIESSGLLNVLSEALIVDDASNDNTVSLCEDFFRQSSQPDKWKLKSFEQNQGRFATRLFGAEQLNTELVLFIDTRVELPENFGKKLMTVLTQHNCLMGLTQLKPEASLYDLYWDRTHTWAFKKHYDGAAQGLWITNENFEEYVKGTTLFLCPRQLFLAVSRTMSSQEALSDDTLLLKKICQITAILVAEELSFYWHPRRNLKEFLKRLYERGPGFTEYHVFARRGLYFYLFAATTVYAGISLAVLIFSFAIGVSLLAIAFGSLALTSFLFSHSMKEAFRLMPIHVLSITSYFLGAFVSVIQRSTKKGQSSEIR